jgi:peroxiredoxin Q/BCP
MAKKTSKKIVKKTAKKTKTTAKKAAKKSKAAPKVSGGLAALAALGIGQKVPNFALPATGGKHIDLKNLRGKNVVLYFYPKDCTPGCTIEGHDFTKLHQQFAAANAEVFGISRDTIALHEKFRLQESYSIDLLSDEQELACKIFAVIKMKNMYGKSVRGIERSTFVLDADGRLVREWRKVKVEGHAQEVLEFIKAGF